jgi:hypothetical protein
MSARSIAGARQRRAGEPVPVSGRQNSSLTKQPTYIGGGGPVGGVGRQPISSSSSQPPLYQSNLPNIPPGYSNSGNNLSNPSPIPGNIQGGPSRGPIPIGVGKGKLSVSDAFSLVTLRLGKLESTVNNLFTKDFVSNLENSVQGEGDFRMTEEIFLHLNERIDTLERTKASSSSETGENTDVFSQRLDSLEKKELNNIANQKINFARLEESNKAVKNKVDELTKKITFYFTELQESKDLLLDLQKYYLELNETVRGNNTTKDKECIDESVDENEKSEDVGLYVRQDIHELVSNIPFYCGERTKPNKVKVDLDVSIDNVGEEREKEKEQEREKEQQTDNIEISISE